MYPEFLVIYIGLGVVILLLAAVLVLLIKLLRSGSAVPRQVTYQPPAAAAVPARPLRQPQGSGWPSARSARRNCPPRSVSAPSAGPGADGEARA